MMSFLFGNRADAIGFNRYAAFINRLVCDGTDDGPPACPPGPYGATGAGELGSPSITDRRTELGKRPGIYGVDAYQLLKLATQGDFLTPTCPSCGIKMVPRKSTQVGREFWGCTNYPRCKQTFFASA